MEEKDDKGRSEGTFRYTVQNFSKLKKSEFSQFSPVFYVMNLTCKMGVKPTQSSEDGTAPLCLGFYLWYKDEKNCSSWSYTAFVELRLISVLPDVKTYSRNFQRLWKSKDNSNGWNNWGFPSFMAWNDVLDPKKGFIKDDAITLEVHVLLLEPFLIEAIQRNSLDDIKSLSIDKTIINTVDDEGNTPFHHAIKSGNIEIVEYFIKSKANGCKPGKNKKTPLLIAVEIKNIDIIKLLLRHGAGETIQSAFFAAVTSENLEIVKLLIEHGALLDVIYMNDHTALTKSVKIENLDIIKVLIEHGADVNMPKNDGTSPLSLALQTGNSKICNYLINNNAKLASESDQAFEYLIKFIENDDFEMIQILMELGAKLDKNYERGETPLTKATKLENFEMVEYLIKKGANVNQSNKNGEVPLAVAASHRDILIVKLLIQSKANLYLAKEEIEEFADCHEDFGIYLKMLKKSSCICGYNTKMNSLGDFDQEAAP